MVTPRDALAEFGAVYQIATCSNSTGLCVHLRPDCAAVTVEREARELTHPGQLPLRCRLCKACDPDATVDMSPEYPAVPAIEDHDDRAPWEASDD